jgi:phytoene dehydrogenase-like protein
MRDLETVEQGEPVVIVGAGMAGLSCAVHLHEAGIAVRVIEACDGVGGRVRTDVVDGFLLDRGFQVYLDAYPETGALLDLEALDLKPFEPGALVFDGSRLRRLMDVFRRPLSLWSSVTAPVGSLWDKLLVGILRFKLLRRSLSAIADGKDQSTEAYLRSFGFSDRMIDRFFRSFYGGIFLESELRTSSRMFEFTFKMFGHGSATLPAKGMGEIPTQLAARLPEGAITLNRRVVSLDRDTIVLEGGETIAARCVVLATDALNVGQLLPALASAMPRWRSVTNLYFAAKASPVKETIICLNGSGTGLVNNVCVLSDAAPSYSPTGEALLSVSILGLHASPSLVDDVRTELVGWFGESVREWRHVRTDTIRQGLPEQLPQPDGKTTELGYRQHEGVWICGDHLLSASIEGAVISGKRVAAAIQEL